MHHGHEICKKTFTFLHGIGKDRLRNIRDSYLTNGLETRVHGNTKRLPHNHLTHAVIINVTKFLKKKMLFCYLAGFLGTRETTSNCYRLVAARR